MPRRILVGAQCWRLFLLCLVAWAPISCMGQATGILRDVNILGSNPSDTPYAVAVDQDHNIYVAGVTASAYFPVSGYIRGLPGVTQRIFLTKFDSSLHRILDSFLLNSGSSDVPTGLVVAPNGHVWIALKRPSLLGYDRVTQGAGSLAEVTLAGQLVSLTEFPADAVALCLGPKGVYVATVEPSVTRVNYDGSIGFYAKLPGAFLTTSPAAIAIDPQENIYVAGTTKLGSFVSTTAIHPSPSTLDNPDLFVVKIDAASKTIVYSTTFGGAWPEDLTGMSVNGDGSVSVIGNAAFYGQDQFPITPDALDPIASGPAGFLTTLSAAGDSLLYSSFLPQLKTASCLIPRLSGDTVVIGRGTVENYPAASVPTTRLLRITASGSYAITNVNWKSSSVFCAVDQDRLAVVSNGGTFDWSRWTDAVTGSRLTPGIAVQTIDMEVTGPPPIDVDAGITLISGISQSDGSVRIVPRTFQLEGAGTVGASNMDGTVRVVEAPGSVDLTIANNDVQIHALSGLFWFFAPGHRDALQFISYFRANRTPVLLLPKEPKLLSKQDQTIAKLAVPIRTVLDSVDVPMQAVTQLLDPHGYFHIDKASGLTPFDLVVTVNPSEIPVGDWRATVVVDVPGAQQRFDVVLKNGTPDFASDPVALNITGVPGSPATTKFTLTTTDDPLEFTLSTNNSDLAVSPSTGITPAEITVTYRVAPYSPYKALANLHVDNPLAVKMDIPVTLSYQASSDNLPLECTSVVPVPGDILKCTVPDIIGIPPGQLHYSLGNIPVSVESVNGSSVILQLPAKLPQQLLELTAKDASGRLVAATYLAAPQYVYPSFHSLVTSDGATIDANHPVVPGDRAVLRITGTGLGNALFDLVSGAKQFQVVRSGFRNGYEPQFEIEFVIPRLYDGQHSLWLHMAHVSTSAFPLWVKNPPPVN